MRYSTMDNNRVSLPITSFQSTLQHILYTAASSGTICRSSHAICSQTLHLAPHCRQQQHLLSWEIGVRACDSSRSGTGKSRTGSGRDCRLDESLISPASFPETQLCIGCVGRGTIMVEQNSSQSCPWPLLLNFLEYLGETNLRIPFRCNCLLIL